MAMGRFGPLAVLLLAVALAVVLADSSNQSSGGSMVWSSAEEEMDLVGQEQPDELSSGDLDGGFSSLEGMLQWAIGSLNSLPFLFDFF